jgi:hypothetical protein
MFNFVDAVEKNKKHPDTFEIPFPLTIIVEQLKSNLCKGCYASQYDFPFKCSVVEDGFEDQCPCNFCLVQVMCSKLCQERREFRRYLYK